MPRERCSACGSDAIEATGADLGEGEAFVFVSCDRCGAEWVETYRAVPAALRAVS